MRQDDSTASLFPPSETDRVLRIDQAIASLLAGTHGGPLGLCLAPEEKSVLGMLRFRRGVANALGIRDIAERLKLTDRQVKSIVRTLRVHFGLPIGSSKNGVTGGYFLIITPDDLAVAVKGPLDQIRAEAEVLRAIAGGRAAAELLGQLTLESGGGQ